MTKNNNTCDVQESNLTIITVNRELPGFFPLHKERVFNYHHSPVEAWLRNILPKMKLTIVKVQSRGNMNYQSQEDCHCTLTPQKFSEEQSTLSQRQACRCLVDRQKRISRRRKAGRTFKISAAETDFLT